MGCLALPAGNALVYECLKTIATIYPSPILIQQSLDTVARFLAARENNLKYAGECSVGTVDV
jgi:AP-4 complex subunit epsilon-1